MKITNKLKLATRASKLIDDIGKVPMGHGPNLTYVGAVLLLVANWLTNSGGLFGPEAAPWISIAIAVLSGLHNLTALAWTRPGTVWTVSSVKALIVSVLLVVIQTLNQLMSIQPEWQVYLADFVQFLQAVNSINWLNKETRDA